MSQLRLNSYRIKLYNDYTEMSPFSAFFGTKRHYTFVFEYSFVKFPFCVFILSIATFKPHCNKKKRILSQLIMARGFLHTTTETHLQKIPTPPPPPWCIFCGTPSKMISYTLKHICAKFGAFTRLVTIFVIFRPNRPD